MTVLSAARYRTITEDTTTATEAITALIEEAEDMLTDALGRPLGYATRTERCWLDRAGSAWPTASRSTVRHLKRSHSQ